MFFSAFFGPCSRLRDECKCDDDVRPLVWKFMVRSHSEVRIFEFQIVKINWNDSPSQNSSSESWRPLTSKSNMAAHCMKSCHSCSKHFIPTFVCLPPNKVVAHMTPFREYVAVIF